MITGYLPDAIAGQWKDEYKPKLFATRKQLHGTQTVTFHRDASDGSDVAIGPYDVVVELSGRPGTGFGAPQGGAGQAVAYVAVVGEFQKEAPFDVRRGDRFCFDSGACGSVTAAPIAEIAYLRAPFVIDR